MWEGYRKGVGRVREGSRKGWFLEGSGLGRSWKGPGKGTGKVQEGSGRGLGRAGTQTGPVWDGPEGS